MIGDHQVERVDVSRKQIKSHLHKYRRKLRDKAKGIEKVKVARVLHAQEAFCSLSDISREKDDPLTDQGEEMTSSGMHAVLDPAGTHKGDGWRSGWRKNVTSPPSSRPSIPELSKFMFVDKTTEQS